MHHPRRQLHNCTALPVKSLRRLMADYQPCGRVGSGLRNWQSYSNPPSNLSESIKARRDRRRKRELAKVFVAKANESVNRTCTICQDEIDRNCDASVTACGHVFHSKCIGEYCNAQVRAGIDRIKDSLNNKIMFRWEANFAIARLMVEYDTGGKNCPNCRCAMPFLHILALKTANRDRIYTIRDLKVTLTATDVLSFVTRS